MGENLSHLTPYQWVGYYIELYDKDGIKPIFRVK